LAGGLLLAPAWQALWADSYHLPDARLPVAKLAATATVIDDFDHVTVIELDGEYNINIDGLINLDPRRAITQAFLAQHADVYDFVVVFSSFEFDTGDALALHIGVQNQVDGIGLPRYDNTALWGSDGRLQGYIDMAAISRYERNPTHPGFDQVLGVLAHEMLHQWCCFVGFERPGDSEVRNDLLGHGGSHWSFLLDTDASVMYGHDWRDNGDGTFTATANRLFYSPLDRYLAGFADPAEVADMLLIENPQVDATALPQPNATVPGTATQVSLADVLRANGPRVPAAAEAQKTFRLGFVYLVRPNAPIFTTQLAFIETVRTAFLERFPIMTGGVGTVEIFPEAAGDTGATGSPQPVTGGPLRPTAADVADALAWLAARQQPEGFWQDLPATRVRDTAAALEALLALDPAFTGRDAAVAWLGAQPAASTDDLAHRARALDLAGADASALRAQLLERQRGDGGWGVAAGFASEPLDTSLVLSALAGHLEASAPPVRAGLDFLVESQDAAGGWGNGVAGASRARVSTDALHSLDAFGARASQALGSAFLATRQNPADGGFGDSPSSVQDTANVLAVLLELDATGLIDRTSAENYLASHQSVDGSWAGSVYTTARAALALRAARRANLVFDAPIILDPPAPSDGQTVQVTLRASNAGGIGTPPSQLDLFAGDPASGGVLIATGVAVPALAPNQQSLLSVPWDTTGMAGAQTLFAVLDARAQVDESSETDNVATLAVEVIAPPAGVELEIDPSSITVTPDAPASLPAELAFFVRVKNLGLSEATAAGVRVFRGDSAAGAVVADFVQTVAPRASALVTFTDTLVTPTEIYTVVVDPDAAFAEQDESNNRAQVEILTEPSVDLEVTPADIVLTSTSLVPGADVSWAVTVRNRGTRDLSQGAAITYSVTDGVNVVPVLGESVFLAAGEARTRTVTWRATLEGNLRLGVAIDSAGALESDVANNQASAPFVITAVTEPNLVVRHESLVFDPDPAAEGQPLRIDLRVENTGGSAASNISVVAYDGNPDIGGLPVADPVQIPSLPAGASVPLSVVWNAPPDAADRFVFVRVDPADQILEAREDDNTAFAPLTVLGLPDLAISPASLTLLPAFPQPGQPLNLTVTIANLGQQPVSGLGVRLFAGDPAAGAATLAPDAVLDVAGNSQAQATFTWSGSPAGIVTLWVVIDPEGLIAERSRANNSAARSFAVEDADFFTSDRFFSPNGDGVLDTVRFFFRLGAATPVRVRVLDAAGRAVRDLGSFAAAAGDVLWDGLRDDGRMASDGAYRFAVLDAAGTVMGAAVVTLDTDRTPLLRAVGTPFESQVDLTCTLPRANSVAPTDDEQWLYLATESAAGSAFLPGIYRISTDDLRLREVFTDAAEKPFDLVVSSDGAKVAWIGRTAAGQFSLWLGASDGSARQRIAGPSPTAQRFPLFFSRDARFLIFAQGRDVRRASVANPAQIDVLASAASPISQVFPPVLLAADRRRMLLDVGSAGPLRLIDLETGLAQSVPQDGQSLAHAAFSADGARLVVGRNGADGPQVTLYDASGVLLSTVVIPQMPLPPHLSGLTLPERSFLARPTWSSSENRLAVEVLYSDGGTAHGCGNGGQLSAQELLWIDLDSGDVQNLLWSAAKHAECDVITYGDGPVLEFGPVTWAPNDQALLVDDPFNGPDGAWAVFLGESDGRVCDPAAAAPCIEDPVNRWQRVLDTASNRQRTAFAPSGRSLSFTSDRDAHDATSTCFDPGSEDVFSLRSLANLTADLRVRRSQDPDAVILEGTAADINFASFALSFTELANAQGWRPIAPVSSRMVIDDFFLTWVPPGPGTWLVRLRVRDRAGNMRDSISQVTAPSFPVLTDVFLDPERFSPDGDGVLDQTVLHYRALQPLHAEVRIFGPQGALARVLGQDAPAPGEYTLVWDGRGQDGRVLADGDYRLELAGFALRVRVDTTPVAVGIELREPYRLAAGGVPVLAPEISYSVSLGRPDELDLRAEIVERGLGAFPSAWQAFPVPGPPIRADALSFAEYAGGRFRVRVEDGAGNQTVATSALAREKLMLLDVGGDQRGGDGSVLALPPLSSQELAALIEHQDGTLSGVVFSSTSRQLRFALAETVATPLVSLSVEVLDPATGVWAAQPLADVTLPGMAAPGPLPEHRFDALWQIPPDAVTALRLRLAAQDAAGTRYLTSGITVVPPSPCTPLTLLGPLSDVHPDLLDAACFDAAAIAADLSAMVTASGLDPELDDLLVALETVDGIIEQPELLLRSNDDPAFAVWTTATLVDRRDGVLLFAPQPALATCSTYTGRVSALSPEVTDPLTGATSQPALDAEQSFLVGCLAVSLAAEVRQAETCGAAPSGLIDVYAQAIDQTGSDDLRGLEVVREGAGGAQEVLFARQNPASGIVEHFVLDVSSWPEGVVPIIVRTENSDGNRRSAALRLVVDRTPPTLRLNAPLEGAVVCGAADVQATIDEVVPTNSADGDVLPLFGTATENAQDPNRRPPTRHRPLPFAHATSASSILSATPDLERAGSDRWVFDGSLLHIDQTDGPVTVRLEMWDQGGHHACAERSFRIDALVPRPLLAVVSPPTSPGTTPAFSPDADGVFDDLTVRYEIAEAGTVDAWVSAGGAPLRSLLAASASGTGQATLRWDGRADDGRVVADGLYQVHVRLRDACGNEQEQLLVAQVDTVAPDVALLFPQLSDTDLPSIVEVRYRRAERYTESLSFGEGHAPTAWQSLPACGSDGVFLFPICLARWNTVGLAGDWILRLRATDPAGNRTEILDPVRLPVRADLITLFEPLPDLFSPNADGRRDSLGLRFGLFEPADIDLGIEDEAGLRLATVAAERVASGSALRSWDGHSSGATPVPDGSYFALLDARLVSDPTRHQRERVHFILDRSAPLIEVSRPLAQGFVRGDEQVLGSITDAHLARWSVALAPAGTLPVFATIGDSQQAGLPAGALAALGDLAEGDYLLRITAEDTGETQARAELAFSVDNTAPEVAISAPASGLVAGAVAGPLEVLGTVADEHLAAWRLEVGAGVSPSAWSELAAGGAVGPSGPRLIAWDISTQADGPYVLRLTASDEAGNQAQDTRPLVVDNTAPAVAISAPAVGGFVTGTTVIAGTANDAHFVEYRLFVARILGAQPGPWSEIAFGAAPVAAGALFTWSALPPDGRYALRIEARDLPGNIAHTSVILAVDATPPAAPLALEATLLPPRDVGLDWADSADSDLAGYRVYRAGALITPSLLVASAYTDSALPEGIASYRVTAVDHAGLESEPSAEARVLVDVTPPEVAVSSPAASARVAGLVFIRGTAWSNDFALYRLFVQPLDAVAEPVLLRQSPLAVQAGALGTWATFGETDGARFRLLLEAEDVSGNRDRSEQIVVVDNLAPPAPPALTADLSGARDVALTWTASPASDLVGYLLYRDGRLVNAQGTAVGDPAPFALDATSFLDSALADGSYTYVVHALDQAGNLSPPSSPASVAIETGPPHAVIALPAPATRFEGTLYVEASSDDRDLATVRLQWRLPGGVWRDLGTPATDIPYARLLDPAALGLALGDLELRAVATDTGGLVDPAPGAITVTLADLTPPDAVSEVGATVDGGTVALTWPASPAADLAGYRVERQPGGRLTPAPITATTWIDAAVGDGRYQYQVRAVDQQGNSAQPATSAEVLVFAPTLDQPRTPRQALDTLLTGAGPRAGDTVLATVADTAGVRTLPPILADAEGAFVLPVTLGSGVNTVAVVLEDSAGNRSKQASVQVRSVPRTSAPTGLGASVMGFDVRVSWNANPEPGLLGYRLSRDGVPLLADQPVADFGPPLASSALAGEAAASAIDGDPASAWVPLGTTGEWLEAGWPGLRLVSAVRVDWLVSGSVVRAAADYRLQARGEFGWVTLATVTGNAASHNELMLDARYRTDRIRILIDRPLQDVGFRAVALSELAVDTTPILDPTLLHVVDTAPDGRHAYTLTAIGAFGFFSPPSNPAGPVDVGDVIPPDPVVLSAQVVGGSDVELRFGPSVDAVRYDLFRDGVKFGEHTDLANLVAIDPQRANGTYGYQVQAFDAVGNGSALSNLVSVTVSVPPPAAPIALRVVAPSEGSALDLSWQPGAGALPVSYRVLRALSAAGPWVEIATTDLNQLRDDGLSNGVRYFYALVALDAAGNPSVASAPASGVPEINLPVVVPKLSFPTVPGRVLATEADIATVIGRAAPAAVVTLSDDGAPLATTTALALTESEFVFSAGLFGPFETSSNGRYLLGDSLFAPSLTDFTAGTSIDLGFAFGLGRFEGDGQHAIFVTFGFPSDQIVRMTLADRSTQVLGTIDHATVAAPAPDGTSIAVIGQRGAERGLWRLEPASGRWTLLSDLGAGSFAVRPRSLRWLPDASHIVYLRDQPPSLVLEGIEVASGAVTPIEPSAGFAGLAVNPASGEVAFSSSRGGVPQIWGFDFTTGASRVLVDNPVVLTLGWSPDGGSAAYSVIDATTGAVEVRARDPLTQADEVVVRGSTFGTFFRWSASGHVTLADHGLPGRLTPAGRFVFDGVPLHGGDNLLTASAGGQISEPIVIRRAVITPDLAVEVAVIPSLLRVGEPLRATVTVRNLGPGDANASTVSMAVIGAGGTRLDLLDQAPVAALAPGAAQTLARQTPFDRPAGHYTVVATADPRSLLTEGDEANNQATASLVVVDTSGPTIDVSTDRARYQAFEDVLISAEVLGGDGGFTGRLRLAVEDDAGFVVQRLEDQPVEGLVFGAQQLASAAWPTGTTFAGIYRVRASLVDPGGTVRAEAFAVFDIFGHSVLEASATTDAASYPRGALVALSGTLAVGAGNEVLDGLWAVLSVEDQAGGELRRWSQALGSLLPGATGTVPRSWDSAGAAAGNYRARFAVRRGDPVTGSLLAEAQTPFALRPAAPVLTGTLTLPVAAPTLGEPLLVGYQVGALGTPPAAGLAGASVRVRLLATADLHELARSTSSVDLRAGAVQATLSLATADLPLGNFLVLLEAALPAPAPVFLLLDRGTSAAVDRTPPSVEVLDPAADGFTGRQPQATIRARDTLSAIARVEVQVDGGAWLAAHRLRDDRYQRALIGLSDGAHTLAVRANDAADNLGIGAAVAFTADATAPVIEISGVVAGMPQESPVVPVIVIVEPHPAHRAIALDGVPYISATPITDGGMHVLAVLAEDQAGNRSERSIQFEVLDRPPDLAATLADALVEDRDADGLASPGDVIAYTLTIVNRGGPATEVLASVPVPSHTTLAPFGVETSLGVVAAEDPITVALGALGADQSARVAFQVRIDDPLPSAVLALSSQASVEAAEQGAVLSDDPDAPGLADATDTEVFITPEIEVSDVTVLEGDPQAAGVAQLIVRTSVAGNRTVRVDYATVAQTAGEDIDYQATAGTLVFEPGVTEQAVMVAVIGDLLFEVDETFRLALSNPVRATLAAGGGATVTIENDEQCESRNLLINPGAELPPPEHGITGWTAVEGTDWQPRLFDPSAARGDAYFFAGEAERAELVQEVDVGGFASRIDAGAQGFVVRGLLRVGDEMPPDAAHIALDFLAADHQVLESFESEAPASILAWFPVEERRLAPVGTRSIRIRLAATAFSGDQDDGYFDGLALRATGVPSLAIDDARVYESDAGAVGTLDAHFTVALSCAIDQPLSVAYSTRDDTARAGADYIAAAGSLHFAVGEREVPLPITVLDDAFAEGEERFTVALSAASSPFALAPVLGRAVGEGSIADSRPCPRERSDWKHDVEDWPVSWLRIGGLLFDRDGLLALLRLGGSDAADDLARHLVASKLNLATGTDPSIQPIVDQADAFLALFPPGSDPRGDDRDRARTLRRALEDYNHLECEDCRDPERDSGGEDESLLKRQGNDHHGGGGHGDDDDDDDDDSGDDDAPRCDRGIDPGPSGCVRGPGYWLVHGQAWPAAVLELGGLRYERAALEGLLAEAGSGAARLLARQLVATRFNLLRGTDPGIVAVADQADSFLSAHPPGSAPSGVDGQTADALQALLDSYNHTPCFE